MNLGFFSPISLLYLFKILFLLFEEKKTLLLSPFLNKTILYFITIITHMNKDYYKTLNINRNATQDEVKKSFRNLSKQHHPDKGGDENIF